MVKEYQVDHHSIGGWTVGFWDSSPMSLSIPFFQCLNEVPKIAQIFKSPWWNESNHVKSKWKPHGKTHGNLEKTMEILKNPWKSWKTHGNLHPKPTQIVWPRHSSLRLRQEKTRRKAFHDGPGSGSSDVKIVLTKRKNLCCVDRSLCVYIYIYI